MPLPHTVEELVLDNGMRGLLIHTPGATAASFTYAFKAGVQFVDRSSPSATAHVMEHLMFGLDADHTSTEEFSRDFSRFGAYYEASTSISLIQYTVKTPLTDWRRTFNKTGVALAKPTFTVKELIAEKGNVIEEQATDLSSNERVLWQTLMRRSGLKRMFDRDESRSINRVTIEDLVEHHRATHSAANMQFVFVGDLAQYKDEIITRLQSWELPVGTPRVIPDDKAHAIQPVYLERTDQVSFSFRIGFLLNRTLSFEEMAVMAALRYAFTGGYESRIYGTARRRGICYWLDMGIETEGSGVSELTIFGQVSDRNVSALFELIAEQLLLAKREGISEAELQAEKEYHLGYRAMQNETIDDLTQWHDEEYFLNYRIDLISDIERRISATTVDQVTAILGEFMDAGLMTIGGYGGISKQTFEAECATLKAAMTKGVKG